MNTTITVLLATYNPNIPWLEQLLQSLNGQDYREVELIAIDDCSTTVPLEDLNAVFRQYITAFPYTLTQNAENLGSTKTFERLTEMASSGYVAYCDQDDIWERTKLQKSLALMKRTGAALICGDVSVINSEGKTIAKSITEIRPRQVFREGKNLVGGLLFNNFVIGCTILMKTETAKAAMPFIDGMVHDHWLAIFAAARGSISTTGTVPANASVMDMPLLRYRIHDTNQTGVLAGVQTKRDYYNRRIAPCLEQMLQITERLKLGKIGEDAVLWAKARAGYYNKSMPKAGITMWKYRGLNKNITYFELAMKFMPRFVFNKALKTLKKGIGVL